MIYIFLAEGFEEIEALTPLDLLRRAGLPVTTVGVQHKVVTGSHGIAVTADILDTEFSDDKPDMVILPGGMPGTLNLDASPIVHTAISSALASGAYIAAICAAPSILGKRGLLAGKRAVCFPGFEDTLAGAILSADKVAIDGRIITAKGMGAAMDFGLALVAVFKGNDTAESLRHAVIAD